MRYHKENQTLDTMGKKGGKRGGGRGKRRGGRNPSRNQIIYREEGTEYAIVTRQLGNGRLEVQLANRSAAERTLAVIPGRMRQRRYWINVDDLLLVAIRDFEGEGGKCDVIHKYDNAHLHILRTRPNELPPSFIAKLQHKTVDADGEADTAHDDGLVFADTDEDPGADEEEAVEALLAASAAANPTQKVAAKSEEPFEFEFDEI